MTEKNVNPFYPNKELFKLLFIRIHIIMFYLAMPNVLNYYLNGYYYFDVVFDFITPFNMYLMVIFTGVLLYTFLKVYVIQSDLWF